MFRALRPCKITLKKTFRATERNSEKNKQKREIFENELIKVPGKNRVCLYDTGTNLGMTVHMRAQK